MNDYREVGVLSNQAMTLPVKEGRPYPRDYGGALACSRFLCRLT
ncbi:MAG: hypothetical protein ACP5SH_23385 [Syntrophobacteraceae bacterium]